MTDVLYNIGERDPITGWGDWADEYYTIYPDGLAVRHFLVHGPRKTSSITEPSTSTNPGKERKTSFDRGGHFGEYGWRIANIQLGNLAIGWRNSRGIPSRRSRRQHFNRKHKIGIQTGLYSRTGTPRSSVRRRVVGNSPLVSKFPSGTIGQSPNSFGPREMPCALDHAPAPHSFS